MKRIQSIRFVSIVLALSLISTIAVDANAAFIYSLRFDQPLYIAPPSGNVTVSLILREEVNGVDTNRITDTNGLERGNVRVNFDTGATKATWSSAVTGSGFNVFTPPVDNGGFTLFTQSHSIGTLANGAQVSTKVREVVLGTVTFSVPNPTGSGSSTNISFVDPSGSNDVEITGFGAIDTAIAYGAARIANPEPSTFLLTGMGVFGAAVLSRFRRRRSKPE